ncbi:lasso peptide biosynthesis B2 protein [Sphingomonas suaedae]|uniref:Lasso peptide biosynthesis B2 protein n=1 Tax=Sphingomonas suaedae TaxID=2599297 RepID=A0A518RCH3_9SPHN|nr:lasso peptide biosynthesis B2 protein [Sphingomonas suaedae]QDX25158.1 lasso peptide biosynthesis B2 protein [Sphingomonas suaedae]
MRYALREGLSFCRVEDRLLFLDLPADRYFCLARDAERSFARLCDTEWNSQDDDPSLGGFVRNGLLVRSDTAQQPAPCPSPTAANRSLFGITPAARAGDTLSAMLHLAHAPLELRAFGLAGALARAGHRKRRASARANAARIARVAAGFEACNAIVSAHDRCLPRSLAIAHALTWTGARPELVLAVKLGPFKAHAWVQCEDMVINERVEVTRHFTPILVI